MFVLSFRASSLRFFAVITLTVAVLIIAIAVGQSGAVVSAAADVDFDGIKTNEDRLAFISACGVEASGEPKETVSFTVPESFDSVIAGYNELQKSQGLDVSRYKNKRVTRYTYEIDGWGEYDGPVHVNLVIYKDTVIAADISSADPKGFISPLVKLA
ncbi:MAG: DUF4830 domain-containing protein [Clostridia bacterium]|nr:DUF4830 domain-containing protein [Clostridia bacterium]